MLKISGAGWANIIIDGKVVFVGSYLTDIPVDFMKALYDYFNHYDKEDKRFSSSVYVDCEGGVANFVFTDMVYSGNGQKVFMFNRADTKTGWEIQAFDIDPYFLAVELIDDVEKDFENWVKWFAPDVKNSRQRLKYWLDKLKEVVKDKGPYAEQNKELNTSVTAENEDIVKARKSELESLKNNSINIPYGHIDKGLPEGKREEIAIKGFTFINAKDTSRFDLISNYIWSLKFKKDLPVQIAYYDKVEGMSAKQTRSRYLIVVRPDSILEDIKDMLLKKGYIKE